MVGGRRKAPQLKGTKAETLDLAPLQTAAIAGYLSAGLQPLHFYRLFCAALSGTLQSKLVIIESIFMFWVRVS